MSAWPDWLDELVSAIRAVEDAEEMIKKLKEGTPEYTFARQQITELERDLEASRERAESLIDRLYAIDIITATAARLRFLRGLMWKEVSYMTGMSESAITARVLRAFRALNEEGTEAGDDSAPPPR